jgi:glycosyltransferase involved in cell wall biosynthesis
MKILNINKYYQYTGGGDRFFFDTAKILSLKGHEVIPYCLDYSNNLTTPYARYFPKGVSGIEVGKQSLSKQLRLFLNGIYSLKAKSQLKHLISETKPDIAHLHIIHYTMSPSVIDVLNNNGIPIVFSLHDYRIVCAGGYLYNQGYPCQKCKKNKYYHATVDRCYRNSRFSSLMGTIGNYLYKLINLYQKVDIFTVPHHNMLEILTEFGIPREKLQILPNPLVFDHDLPSPSLGKLVLFFGHLSTQKGIFTLLRAAANLPDIPFVICGRGPALREIKSVIEQKQMTNITIDTHTRWGNGLENIIASSRFIVSPSEWPTPLEYSTLEAMAIGKALVASRIGGNQEIITEGITGMTFEPGNSLELETVIRYLYSHPELCTQMGMKGRYQIQTTFSVDSFYREVMSIYKNAQFLRQNRTEIHRKTTR